MKKNILISTILSIIFSFLFPLSFASAANEDYSMIDINNKKKLSAYEMELLDELYQIAPDLYNPDDNIVSVSKTDYDFDEEGNASEIMPYGTIPTSDMSLIVVVSKISSNRFSVKTTATWKIEPFFQKRDVLGIACGRSQTITSSSIVERYKNGDVSYLGYPINSTPNAGIVYEFPMRKVLNPTSGLDTPLSSVTLTATLQTNNTGSTNVVSKYGHAMTSIGGFGVSISGSPSISLSISGTYDEAIKYTYFNH